jgi:flavin-binding protein dodecin
MVNQYDDGALLDGKAAMGASRNGIGASKKTAAGPWQQEDRTVSDNVYAVSQIVGSSPTSIEDAIANAVSTASASLRNLEWFEVSEIRGHIVDGKVGHYQVGLKLGFRYER